MVKIGLKEGKLKLISVMWLSPVLSFIMVLLLSAQLPRKYNDTTAASHAQLTLYWWSE